MSLLGMGSATRKGATDALRGAARIQEKENQIAAGIENQKRAQEAQTLGTAAGLGSMYGLNKSYGASKTAGDALTAINESPLSTLGEFSFKGGGLNFQPTGGELVEGVTGLGDIAGGVEALTVAPEAVVAGEGVSAAAATAATEAAATEAATLAATTGETLVGGAAAAAPGTGAMATLGAVAAPIGIALGVGFLLNKIFG